MFKRQPLLAYPLPAPVQQTQFDLVEVFVHTLSEEEVKLQDGDVIAISSKYCSISEGNVIKFEDVSVTPEAEALATRYGMNPIVAQVVMSEADHIFGGIQGFLLTFKDGILSPNAGIDRSNIPNGQIVLFPVDPYASAARIREEIRARLGVTVGVILTDSWLMPGRLGTTGVALATAGFKPTQDERGKLDLFGNPMQVTVRGVADTICAAAQLVMGERDESMPFVIVRNTGVEMTEEPITVADVAIEWERCIYVESLTKGLL